MNHDPDGTKLIVSPDICGVLTPTAGFYGQAIAIAQSNGGGQAAAFAQVNPAGALAFAQSSGGGTAAAYTQFSGTVPPHTSGTAWQGSGCAYTIQSGDTLYSIATRHNTTAAALASANNIADPALIYAGQTLNVCPR